MKINPHKLYYFYYVSYLFCISNSICFTYAISFTRNPLISLNSSFISFISLLRSIRFSLTVFFALTFSTVLVTVSTEYKSGLICRLSRQNVSSELTTASYALRLRLEDEFHDFLEYLEF